MNASERPAEASAASSASGYVPRQLGSTSTNIAYTVSGPTPGRVARATDASLILGFPTTRASLRRKFTRDLLGVTGLKRIYGLLNMDFGFIAYTAANDVRHLPQEGRSKADVARFALRRLLPLSLSNVS
ncbi:MAG: hypothetical protein GY822_10015 [Deltaproteobacteria bacterium]|nr:hypothetical protein [Deltaproteobacteria bacterium]